MPKRYKPSEKMPKIQSDIIIQIKDRREWMIGERYQGEDCHRPWIIPAWGSIYSNDQIDWWLDPMEEDLSWKPVETNPPACDGRYLAYPSTVAEVCTALFSKEEDRWIDLEDYTEPWRPRVWREIEAPPEKLLPEEEE